MGNIHKMANVCQDTNLKDVNAVLKSIQTGSLDTFTRGKVVAQIQV